MQEGMTLDLQLLDPDDERQLDAIVALFAATDAVDAPWRHGATPRSIRQEHLLGYDGDPEPFYLIRRGSDLVAVGAMALPSRDNLDSGWIYAAVRVEQLQVQGHAFQGDPRSRAASPGFPSSVAGSLWNRSGRRKPSVAPQGLPRHFDMVRREQPTFARAPLLDRRSGDLRVAGSPGIVQSHPVGAREKLKAIGALEAVSEG